MNEHLLLVEDDDAIADVMRLHLEQAGYRVHRESDGCAAMAAVDRENWALVLLDLMLPGADGWEVCRHLRSRHGHVPIIMVSARSAEAHRVLGLELGADDYLAKPFSMLELTARVRALLRRVEQIKAEPLGTALLPIGPLHLDPVRRELRKGSTVIGLTLREFDLLHFLARHPDQVFSRASLLQRVWGDGFDGYEHTVNSHINRLRSKLAGGGDGQRMIHTVWGLGYRFNATERAQTAQTAQRRKRRKRHRHHKRPRKYRRHPPHEQRPGTPTVTGPGCLAAAVRPAGGGAGS